MAEKKERQSNIELLRILCMVMIIAHHFSYHSWVNFPEESVTVNRLWNQFLYMGGKIGVDVFVMISGYFMISAKEITWEKVVKLWLQIATYSIGIYGVLCGMGEIRFDGKELVRCFFPISNELWWFASAYFLMYLFSPYWNRLLNGLQKAEYRKLLMLGTLCFIVVPTFIDRRGGASDLVLFMYLYAVGGYIRLHSKMENHRAVTYFLGAGLVVSILFAITVFCDFYGRTNGEIAQKATYWYRAECIPVIALSVLLLMGFLRLNIGSVSVINSCSGIVFGVYLLHDSDYIRPILWQKIFHAVDYRESHKFIPYSIGAILTVLVVCGMIELVRKWTLEHMTVGIMTKLKSINEKKNVQE